MVRHLLCCLALAISSTTAFSIPNVNATFEHTPRPFEIAVDPAFISDLHNRVKVARAPFAIQGAEGDGPSLTNFTILKNYWIDEYKWTSVESSINQRYAHMQQWTTNILTDIDRDYRLKQFTTIVKNNQSTYKLPTPLHFVHHRSSRSDAIPLLFVHGWPGSFLEVDKIIDSLTNPPNTSVPAFHVVAPSIPGFGFSPAPEHPGFGPAAAAHTFHALMLQLNYTKYVGQGGDFGAITLRNQAAFYPDHLVSLLSNFWPMQPRSDDITRLIQNLTTPDETAYINTIEHFFHQDSGYRLIQETEPLALAYSLTDSPLGTALWIYALMERAVDPRVFQWKPEDVITWSLMYSIQGPYAGLRFYKEALADRTFVDFELGGGPFVPVPVAISEFPYDIWYKLPLDWAQRQGNVKVRNVHDRGGHFAATEVPEVLVEDIWIWFGNRELSGTSVFTIS